MNTQSAMRERRHYKITASKATGVVITKEYCWCDKLKDHVKDI